MAYFIDQSGTVVEIPDEEAKDAGLGGYVPATPEQVASAQANAARKAEFGTLPQQLLGGVEAIGRGASFSLTDPLAVALGADPERIAGRREALGGLGTALEVGGAVAPALFGAPEAAFAKLAPEAQVALRAAGQAPGIVSRTAAALPTARLSEAAAGLGERAATRVFGDVAAGELPGVARSAFRGGVSELVEGLPYASGQVASEAVLGDHDLTAEEALMGVGLGTALSGGLGAAFGAAGGGLGLALRKAQKSADKAMQLFEDRYPEWISGAVNADPENIRYAMRNAGRLTPTTPIDDIIAERYPVPAEPAPFTPRDMPPEAIYTPPGEFVPTPKTPKPPGLDIPETVTVGERTIPNPVLSRKQTAQFADEVASALDDTFSATKELESQFNDSLRLTERARLLDGKVAPEAAQAEALRLAKRLNAVIEQGKVDGPNNFSSPALLQLEKTRDGLLRNIVGEQSAADIAAGLAAPPPLPSKVFKAIDDAKGEIQRLQKQVPYQTSQGPHTRQMVGDVAADFRKSLESPAVWGEAGARHAAVNRAFTEMLDAQANALPLVSEGLTTKGRKYPEVTISKVKKLLTDVEDPAQAERVARVYKWLDKMRTFRDEVQSTADAIGSEVDRSAVEAAEQRVKKLVEDEREVAKITGEQRRRIQSSAKERAAWKEAEASRKELDAARLSTRKREERIRKLEAKKKADEFTASEAERKETAKALDAEYRQQVKDRNAEIKAEGVALRAGARWNGFMDIIGAGAVGQNPVLAPLFVAYRFGKYLGSPDKTIRVLQQLKNESAKAKAGLSAMAEELVSGRRVRLAKTAGVAALTDEAVDRIVTDPESASEMLADGTAEMRDFAPNVAQAMQGTLIRGATYLASIKPRPQSGQFGTMLPPSGAAVAQYESVKAVVEDPKQAFVLATEGRLLPTHVEALQQVWPKVLEQMQIATLDALTDQMKMTGKAPNYRVLQQASIIVGFDMTNTQNTLAANQAMMDEAPPQPPTPAVPRADKMTLANRSQTPWEASEGN